MNDHDERLRQSKKPQLNDADKALLEAEPDWERMGQGAKRLLGAKPEQPNARRSVQAERLKDRGA